MELLPFSLKWALENNLINTWKVIWDVAIGITEGVCYLHENYIEHRDLKAANVLLDNDLTPKLCDFGKSKHTIEQHFNTIEVDELSSPTHKPLDNSWDFSSDVYTLGMVLYELATKQNPYHRIANIKQEQRANVLPEIQFNCNYHFKNIILKCLHNVPKQRPTAHNVLQEMMVMKPTFTLGNSIIFTSSVEQVNLLLNCNVEQHVKCCYTLLQQDQKYYDTVEWKPLSSSIFITLMLFYLGFIELEANNVKRLVQLLEANSEEYFSLQCASLFYEYIPEAEDVHCLDRAYHLRVRAKETAFYDKLCLQFLFNVHKAIPRFKTITNLFKDTKGVFVPYLIAMNNWNIHFDIKRRREQDMNPNLKYSVDLLKECVEVCDFFPAKLQLVECSLNSVISNVNVATCIEQMKLVDLNEPHESIVTLHIGLFYYSINNFEEAFKCFNKSTLAEAKLIMARKNCEDGKNYAESFAILKKCALQTEQRVALQLLKQCYLYGYGTEKNENEAINLQNKYPFLVEKPKRANNSIFSILNFW